MQQQGKFGHEFPFAILDNGINIVENPSISSRPDGPSHQNYDLHGEGDCELILDHPHNLKHWPRGRYRGTN
jgi:hypothetical protein